MSDPLAEGTRHIITGTSPSSASTAIIGSPVGNLDDYSSLMVVAVIQGATGGTLDLYLQTSVDGSNWYDYAHFAQLSAAAAQITRAFTVSRHGQQTTITAIGSGTSPALAAGTVIGGEFGTRMRLLAVAGAGTSAGATQTVYIIGTRTR